MVMAWVRGLLIMRRRLALTWRIARIFIAAPSLAYLISHPTEPFAATGLPDVYELTEKRLQGIASASEVESPFPPHPDTAFTVQI